MNRLVVLLVALTMTTVVGCSKTEEDASEVKVGKQVGEVRQKLKTYNDERMQAMDRAIERAGEEKAKAQ
jgi:hypothetical protein